MKFKQICCLLLTVLLLATVAACGSQPTPTEAPAQAAPTEAPVQEPTAAPTEAPVQEAATEPAAPAEATEEAAAGAEMNQYPGAKVLVSRWAGDPWEGSMRELGQEWGGQTGATVTIDAIPYENLREKQVLEMSSGTGTYDVVYVHPSWFGEYVQAGYLLPLDDYLNDPALNPSGFSTDNYVPSIFRLGNSEGKQYAMQDFIATVLLAYRKDVFEAEGIAPPESWEDILAAAEKLNGKDGMAGIVMPGKRTGAVADVYSSLIIGADTWYFDENNKPALDVDAAAQAMQFYAQAAKFAPEGVLNFHWDEAVTAAAQGKSAMLITLSTTLAWLDDPGRSSTVGKWGYLPLKFKGTPAGEVIYWNWAIPADSQNPKAAYEFLRWFTAGPQQSRVAVKAFTGGATKDFYADPTLTEKLPFMGAVQEALTKSQPQPSLADWPQVQEVIELGVQDSISGNATPEEAAQSVRDILDKLLVK